MAACIVAFLALAPEVSAQIDPGIADTIRIDSLTGILAPHSALDIFLFNDEALSALEVTIVSSDTLATVDSVSFVDSRIDYVFTKGWVINDSTGAATFYCYPSDELLIQPGNGLLATVHFAHPDVPSFPHDVIVDTITIEIDLITRSTLLRDSIGTVFAPQVRPGLLRIEGLSCCPGWTGNVNGDSGGSVDLSDLIYLVNYLFLGGPDPECPAAANINGDEQCAVDLSDLIYFVNYLFLGGPDPSACLTACL